MTPILGPIQPRVYFCHGPRPPCLSPQVTCPCLCALWTQNILLVVSLLGKCKPKVYIVVQSSVGAWVAIAIFTMSSNCNSPYACLVCRYYPDIWWWKQEDREGISDVKDKNFIDDGVLENERYISDEEHNSYSSTLVLSCSWSINVNIKWKVLNLGSKPKKAYYEIF